MTRVWAAAVAVLVLIISCFLCGTASAAGVTSEQLAYYRFDCWQSAGTSIADESGNGWFMQIVGGSPSMLVSPGVFERLALRFGGSDGQFAVIGAPLDAAEGVSWSVSLWLQVLPGSGGGVVQDVVSTATAAASAGTAPWWALQRLDASVRLAVAVQGATPGAMVASASEWVPVDERAATWTHVVVTRAASGTWALHVNGAAAGTLSAPGTVADPAGSGFTMVGGRLPHGASGATNTFNGTLDNMRMFPSVLTSPQAAHLFATDEGPVSPPSYPATGWQANVHSSRRQYGSYPGGAFDVTTVSTGTAFMDTAVGRAVRRFTNDATPARSTYSYVFSLEEGQLGVTAEWDAAIDLAHLTSDNVTCTVNVQGATCSGWPTAFAQPAAVGGASFWEAQCPVTGDWVVSQWDGPPATCIRVDGDGVQCSTSYSYGSTQVVTRADGVPITHNVSACTPSHQSISCTAIDIVYTDATLGSPSDELFAGVPLAACVNTEALCDVLCHGRGTCAGPDAPGTCVCDAGWTGIHCADPVPASCVLSEWSEWGPCSVDCGTGSQSRTATWLPPPSHPDLSCVAVVETQSRPCSTQPCSNSKCADCAGNSAGPCRNPHNNVCYAFYFGTTTCPAGTTSCAAPCDACAANTAGPCRHDSDGTCVPFASTTPDGVGVCAAGSTLCADAEPETGACSGCWPGTAGTCQQDNTVCWNALPDTDACPAGTRVCADDGSYPAAAVVVVDTQLAGVAIDRFREEQRAAFVSVTAATAGVPTENVRIEAVRDGTALVDSEDCVDVDCQAQWVTDTGDANANGATATPTSRVGFILVLPPDTTVATTPGAAASSLATAIGSAAFAADLRAAGLAQVTATALVADVAVVNGDGAAGQGSDGTGADADSDPSSWMLLGIIAAGVVAAALVAFAILVVVRRRATAGTPVRATRTRKLPTPLEIPGISPHSTRAFFPRTPASPSSFASHSLPGSPSHFGAYPPSPSGGIMRSSSMRRAKQRTVSVTPSSTTLDGSPLPVAAPVVETLPQTLGRTASWHGSLRAMPAPSTSALFGLSPHAGRSRATSSYRLTNDGHVGMQ